MHTSVVLILFLLIGGCSTGGPWKAPHPEDVAQQCPGHELNITAHVEGQGGQSFHKLDTQCGEGGEETHSSRVDLSGTRTGTDLRYQDANEDRTVTIHEHREQRPGAYDHSYERTVKPKKNGTSIKSWTYFNIKRR